jgi:hypothetical protein
LSWSWSKYRYCTCRCCIRQHSHSTCWNKRNQCKSRNMHRRYRRSCTLKSIPSSSCFPPHRHCSKLSPQPPLRCSSNPRPLLRTDMQRCCCPRLRGLNRNDRSFRPRRSSPASSRECRRCCTRCQCFAHWYRHTPSCRRQQPRFPRCIYSLPQH